MRTFCALLLLALLWSLSVVLAAPPHGHGLHHRHHHNWLRENVALVEGCEKNNTCPNLPAPIDSWFDYSAKIRGYAGLKTLSKRAGGDTCSEDSPCANGACCAKTGNCGYGKDYCGDGKTPNDVCWSNCDAHAECGKDAKVVNTTCPLNVCCSEFGFCGTTDEFCGTKCQSNCFQPDGSGESQGAVQTRLVGYYEAWNYNKTCVSMNTKMKKIPVTSLNYLVFAFGYITPDDYDVVPMTGIPDDILTQVTDLKEDNPACKMMISIGGWNFNNNHTKWQPVFSDVVGSKDHRSKFITNLIAFMDKYAFDGVDFDWEYPGAPDRGGNDDDGKGYSALMKELREALDKESRTYTISFTAPTSYYYLRHFDLVNMMDHVDFCNLMAYDLHGTWDGPSDHIGSIVLAHTNMTEISAALDLFWRNKIDLFRINLGVGFYGRSFQLSDTNCRSPGCPFKGGADAGTCSGQSGILSYKEIMKIMDSDDITPYWDESAAVKYMTWGKDQWVSFDDRETFQQKVLWANGQNLGGLAIWALDQDSDDLQALQGLIYPEYLDEFYNKEADADYWQDVSGGTCHLTDCGDKCSSGEILITSQKCSNAVGDKGKSQLCCPLSSAPDPSTCRWRGGESSSLCNGRCHENEVAMEQNPWGDGGHHCSDGNKVYCCDVPEGKSTGCRVTGCGGDCNDDETSMTSDFYDECFWDPKKICCPKDNDLGDCHWQGKPGSCYNNVCDFDTEIELAASFDGGGDDCGFFHPERKRVFCCGAPGGNQPFLPVPLDYLFPSPPSGDTADTKYKLDLDDTWGGAVKTDGNNKPNDASFGFFVMTSPKEIQTSLDKRDGSHWEMFDCFDDTSEEEHVVRMFCQDDSPGSNCYDISLGHGVPGTILEMPKGCGPGRYAVAQTMTPSKNQTIPGHIQKRSPHANPVVYDLKFDYDFRRVPRDLGSTQFRLDYSNQENYWDKIVDRAGDKKRKRSLDDLNRNHKRFLEEAWREDHKHGLLSRDEMHKRWFGSDVLDWLKGLFEVATSDPEFSHSVSEQVKVILLNEEYQCTISDVDVEASLQISADLTANINTQFGLTIIATMDFPPDLSNSYLYFRNNGTVTAQFSIDALASASYSTGDRELLGLEDFGATFSIPGILTVGPNFRLFGSVNMDISMSGKFTANTVLAKWDVQQAFPDQESKEDPSATTKPDQDGTQEVGKPSFDWSITANGQITAHVKPKVSFGINFNQKFLDINPCEVDLVADGYLQFYADAELSKSSQSICYGANSGGSLYTELLVPDSFNWALPNKDLKYTIYSLDPVAIIDRTCPVDKRDMELMYLPEIENTAIARSQRNKRGATVVGPLLHLPFGLSCPEDVDEASGTGNATCPLCSSSSDDTSGMTRRDDGEYCLTETYTGSELTCSQSTFSLRDLHPLSKRLSEKQVVWLVNGDKYDLFFGSYPPCGQAAKTTMDKYYTFEDDGSKACSPTFARLTKDKVKGRDMITEHVFEVQIFKDFYTWLYQGPPLNGYTRPSFEWVTEAVIGIDMGIDGTFMLESEDVLGTPKGGDGVQAIMAYHVGSSDHLENLCICDGPVNSAKNTWFGGGTPDLTSSRSGIEFGRGVRNGVGVFTYLNFKGDKEWIWNKFMRVSNWVDLVCYTFDQQYKWKSRTGEPTNKNGDPSLRSLWNKFIDQYLSDIETRAGQWVKNQDADYKQYFYDKDNAKSKALYNNMFGPSSNGWAYKQAKLPRSPGSPSRFGAYANPAMTKNYRDVMVNLPAPAKI